MPAGTGRSCLDTEAAAGQGRWERCLPLQQGKRVGGPSEGSRELCGLASSTGGRCPCSCSLGGRGGGCGSRVRGISKDGVSGAGHWHITTLGNHIIPCPETHKNRCLLFGNWKYGKVSYAKTTGQCLS